MNPYPGQMIMVFTDPAHANGADEAPAVITRVWTPGMASVRIFHDGPCPPDCTDRATVALYGSRAEAEALPRVPGLIPSGGWPLPSRYEPGDTVLLAAKALLAAAGA